ncbi:MAG: alpha-amylase [Rhodobiaceae bacterium]|nr:MAG: alpha-amylase [Rhodobiaceae bacterium]
MTYRFVRPRGHIAAACVALAVAFPFSPSAFAHEGVNHDPDASNAYAHAPIGVMGDHLHKQGEWMFSYRFSHMNMSDNRDGTNSLSPEEIVSGVANRFAPPANLRIVPLEMSMDMHMVGAMYAPSDIVTLTVMGMYVEKEMEHVTFAGMAGTTRRGTFTTSSSGIGDTSVTALVRLHNEEGHYVHANLGVSLPTGSIRETGQILTPMGATPTVRLPYAMQLGSGTYDLMPGLTYSGDQANWGWGAQWRSTLRLGTNTEGYSLGNRHEITGWAAYQFQPWISLSGRLAARSDGKLDGIDRFISGPVQTADPDNYGGERVEGFVGVNLVGQSGFLKGQRVAIEFGAPLYQSLNGPQLETDYRLTVGWQKAF